MVNITLDELAGMIQNQFGEVNKQFGEVNKQFGEVNKQFGEVNKQFGEVNKRFDQLENGQEEILLKLSNVAYRFELEEVKQRVLMLEKKLATK